MLLIKNGTVVTAENSYRADVLCADERIQEIAPRLKAPAKAQVIDAKGCLLMPGGIDPHTHMQLPFMGTVAADDYYTGTRAALSGGTTMIVDFCIPSPKQAPWEAYQQWREWAQKSVCDYSFHLAVTWWSKTVKRDMHRIAKEGVNTFKHFMAYKGAIMVDDEVMLASFNECAKIGGTPLVHAENGEAVYHLQHDLLRRGYTGPEAHAWSRPPDVEGEAVNRAIVLAGLANVPLYVVHTSCAQAHDAIRRARARGQRVYGEPLIQHLTLDETEYMNKDWKHAARRVMSPPFRAKEHQDDLWNGLVDGSLQVVATDHCAFKTSQKKMGAKDFTMIPNGTGGIEDRMPVLWTHGVNTGRLTPNEFVAVTSTNSAKILNIYPRKGALREGADADIVVWDPEATKVVRSAKQFSAIDYNVFEGFKLKGLPRTTILRGSIAYAKGKVLARRGQGIWIKRPTSPPANVAMRERAALSSYVAVKR